MDKVEVIEKMMNSENGGLYAAIGGIVLVYGIDRVTKMTDDPEEKPAEESEDKQG